MPNLNNSRGQGLVEYILIVMLMGVFAIAVVQSLGRTTQDGFTRASDQLEEALSG